MYILWLLIMCEYEIGESKCFSSKCIWLLILLIPKDFLGGYNRFLIYIYICSLSNIFNLLICLFLCNFIYLNALIIATILMQVLMTIISLKFLMGSSIKNLKLINYYFDHQNTRVLKKLRLKL